MNLSIAFKYFYHILFSVVFGVALAFIILSALSNRTGIRMFIVQSGSMEPSIPIGSIVITKQKSQFSPGDVITFQSPNIDKIPVTHRISEIKTKDGEEIIFTKGDANSSIDLGSIKPSAIIGSVLFHVPYVGYIAKTQQQPIGFFALVIIPCLILIFSESKNIIASLRKPKTVHNQNLQS